MKRRSTASAAAPSLLSPSRTGNLGRDRRARVRLPHPRATRRVTGPPTADRRRRPRRLQPLIVIVVRLRGHRMQVVRSTTSDSAEMSRRRRADGREVVEELGFRNSFRTQIELRKPAARRVVIPRAG